MLSEASVAAAIFMGHAPLIQKSVCGAEFCHQAILTTKNCDIALCCDTTAWTYVNKKAWKVSFATALALVLRKCGRDEGFVGNLRPIGKAWRGPWPDHSRPFHPAVSQAHLGVR